MLYMHDTNPMSNETMLGIQELFASSTNVRKELSSIRGQIMLLSNSREMIYGVIKRNNLIGYVHLTMISDVWTVSGVQILGFVS